MNHKYCNFETIVYDVVQVVDNYIEQMDPHDVISFKSSDDVEEYLVEHNMDLKFSVMEIVYGLNKTTYKAMSEFDGLEVDDRDLNLLADLAEIIYNHYL